MIILNLSIKKLRTLAEAFHFTIVVVLNTVKPTYGLVPGLKSTMGFGRGLKILVAKKRQFQNQRFVSAM